MDDELKLICLRDQAWAHMKQFLPEMEMIALTIDRMPPEIKTREWRVIRTALNMVIGEVISRAELVE